MLNTQFLKFVAVGIVNTAFSYGTYAAFIYLGFSFVLASLISFILGILFSFKTQGALVFKNTDRRLLFVFTFNWLLIYLFMVGFIALMINLGFNEYWAGVLAMPPLAIFSYVTQKYLVFRNKPGPAASTSLPLKLYLKNYRHFIRKLATGSGHGNIQYGAHTYGTPLVQWWGEEADLIIGKYCSIAKDVEIFLGGNHRTEWISTYPFPAFTDWANDIPVRECCVSRGDVIIGNDVWIGSGAVILSGVTIGNGAVIGSHAIVTRNIPDYAIVAGNPARVVRIRFSAEQVAQLSSLAWWDWDTEKVRKNIGDILSEDIDNFLCKHATNNLHGSPIRTEEVSGPPQEHR